MERADGAEATATFRPDTKTSSLAGISKAGSALCVPEPRGGTVGVGRATTSAVVWSALAVLLSDLLLTKALLSYG